MMRYNYSQLLHIEGDNLLYQNLHDEVIPIFQEKYKYLATTRLSSTFITASALWIGNVITLHNFTEYLLDLANLNGSYHRDEYLSWLRPKACCIKGGVKHTYIF